ncbi:MAG: rRNA maturation RNase YbeY [Actinomycetes bacterium]
MSIDILNRSGVDCKQAGLESLLAFAMEQLGLHDECELNVLLVDEKEMTELHIKWMEESGPTDVLSFPMDEIRPHHVGPAILGDIVLCPTIAQSQADDAGHEFEFELAILSVHGLLHLLGYDHAIAHEETEMFALQEELVARWRA